MASDANNDRRDTVADAFYEFALTAWISGRADLLGNLFASPVVPDRLEYCRVKAAGSIADPPILRMLNLDNDIITAAGTHMPATLKHPCNVPPAVRRKLTDVGDLHAAVLASIKSTDYAAQLGVNDWKSIETLVRPMGVRLSEYVRSFGECGP